MAESSALSFSSFSCSISTFSPSRSKDTSSTTPTRLSSFLSKGNSLLYRRQRQSSLLLRCGARDSGAGDFIGDNSFGFYPWQFPITDGGDGGAIQWVPEDRVTLLTADGLVQIGGSMVPHRLSSSNKKQGRLKTSQRLQRFQESDYMDPNQGLCLGSWVHYLILQQQMDLTWVEDSASLAFVVPSRCRVMLWKTLSWSVVERFVVLGPCQLI